MSGLTGKIPGPGAMGAAPPTAWATRKTPFQLPRLLRSRLLPVALASLLLSGCAATPVPPEEHDPYERFNRAMFTFNDQLDRKVAKPVAEGYRQVVPDAVDRGITNFFGNLGEVGTLINDLLQGKLKEAGGDFARLSFNSTAGIFGLFDVATPLGLPKRNEDFGQTLGRWGVASGPYLVLPFLGPSTLRDGSASLVDWSLDPVAGIEDDPTYWSTVGLRALDLRADLLQASRLLETAALDPYVFTREAYIQHRRNVVYDGNPPLPEFDIFEEEGQEGENPPGE